jgi:hypothetical protein
MLALGGGLGKGTDMGPCLSLATSVKLPYLHQISQQPWPLEGPSPILYRYAQVLALKNGDAHVHQADPLLAGTAMSRGDPVLEDQVVVASRK